MENKITKIILGILFSLTFISLVLAAPVGEVFHVPDINSTITFIPQMCYINSLTDIGSGGIFGIVMLLIIFGGFFFTMKSFKFESALPVAMFITSIIGVLLRLIPCLINDYIMYVCIIVLIYSIYLLFKESSNYET
jgi:hypothetical protein